MGGKSTQSLKGIEKRTYGAQAPYATMTDRETIIAGDQLDRAQPPHQRARSREMDYARSDSLQAARTNCVE